MSERKKDISINRVISKTDALWVEIREYNFEIVNFLCNNEETENIAEIFVMALKLIIAELILNKDKYIDYDVEDCSTEDLFNSVISLSSSFSKEKEDDKKIKIQMEEIRYKIWGYIVKYYDELVDLLLSLRDRNEEEEEEISEREYNRFLECVCVAFVETNLKDREVYLMEKQYGL